MSRLLDEFDGSRLYLDTMIPYALLRAMESQAQSFFERIARGELLAYTSVLTFDELSYRLLLALIRDKYDGSPLHHLRNREAEMIQEFYPFVSRQLAELRAYPNLTLVNVTGADLERMDVAMQRYHIRPRDALHLAAMQQVGCLSLVSHDQDWDRVPVVDRYRLS